MLGSLLLLASGAPWRLASPGVSRSPCCKSLPHQISYEREHAHTATSVWEGVYIPGLLAGQHGYPIRPPGKGARVWLSLDIPASLGIKCQ
jgi:hypothetical protein